MEASGRGAADSAADLETIETGGAAATTRTATGTGDIEEEEEGSRDAAAVEAAAVEAAAVGAAAVIAGAAVAAGRRTTRTIGFKKANCQVGYRPVYVCSITYMMGVGIKRKTCNG